MMDLFFGEEAILTVRLLGLCIVTPTKPSFIPKCIDDREFSVHCKHSPVCRTCTKALPAPTVLRDHAGDQLSF